MADEILIPLANQDTLLAVQRAVDTYLDGRISDVLAVLAQGVKVSTESTVKIDSVVKSVQHGATTSAGTIVIAEVAPNKSFVLSVSKGSEGYVAARGTINISPAYYGNGGGGFHAGTVNAQTLKGSLSGGETSLTARQYSAKLVDSTTLSCDGPVEWQLIEYI